MQALISLISIITFLGPPAPVATPVEPHLAFDDPMHIAQIAVDVEGMAWGKGVIEEGKTLLAADPTPRHALLQITLNPDRAPNVLVLANPELPDEAIAALRALPPTTARSKHVPITITFHFIVAKGAPAPKQRSPRAQEEERFEAAKTAARLESLRRWAREEALLVLGAHARGVDPKFEGVRAMGRVFAEAAATPLSKRIDVAALTDRNPDYWRALMEMVSGDPLIVIGRAFMEVANGDVDRAKVYLRMLFRGPLSDNPGGWYTHALARRVQIFDKGVSARINKGIVLFDGKKFDDAMKLFDQVITDYPCSAWAHHERAITFYKKGDESGRATAQARVFDCQPMYQAATKASSGKEVYQVMRRMKLGELFKDQAKRVEDITLYADIALDLDQPGLAALSIWITLPVVLKDDKVDLKERLRLYLYALNQLGVTELRSVFNEEILPKDPAPVFKRIDEQRAAAMKAHPLFKTMARPE